MCHPIITCLDCVCIPSGQFLRKTEVPDKFDIPISKSSILKQLFLCFDCKLQQCWAFIYRSQSRTMWIKREKKQTIEALLVVCKKKTSVCSSVIAFPKPIRQRPTTLREHPQLHDTTVSCAATNAYKPLSKYVLIYIAVSQQLSPVPFYLPFFQRTHSKLCGHPVFIFSSQQPCEIGYTERKLLVQGHPASSMAEWGFFKTQDWIISILKMVCTKHNLEDKEFFQLSKSGLPAFGICPAVLSLGSVGLQKHNNGFYNWCLTQSYAK